MHGTSATNAPCRWDWTTIVWIDNAIVDLPSPDNALEHVKLLCKG